MKISVVTVTYNSEKTVEDTIKSVLSQEYKDYEYLVVDGGSKDNTVEIIKKYEPLFEGRMRWISEKDKGMYDGINKGIKMATGDVVGIINSDDFYPRTDIFDKINEAFSGRGEVRGERYVNCKRGDRVEAIYGDVRFVNPDNLEKTVRYYSSKNWRPWRFRFGFMPAHPSFFTLRENFEKYGYYQYDYHIAADYELLIRHLYTNKVPAKYIPLDFMKMRTGGRSTDGIQANIRLNKEIVRACAENGIWTCMPLLFLKYFVKVFELVFTRGES
ncbi:MAG: glycosyltransferase [Paludibacteraceae bacterium]|nr:glycosyltransferase [Paludibacteraceae bacterium]